MALRKPAVSVQEARRLSSARAEGVPLPPVVEASPDEAEPDGLDQPLFESAGPVAMPDRQPQISNPTRMQDRLPPVIEASPDEAEPDGLDQPLFESAGPVAMPGHQPQISGPSGIYDRPPAAPAMSMIGSRVQVFVSAAFPKAGVSASFDMLSAKYPPAKALQMILRRALDEYEDRLADGTFATLAESYPASGNRLVQTSRIMPQELADLARLHFDPLGFESARAFGLKLATAALAAFFASERMRR